MDHQASNRLQPCLIQRLTDDNPSQRVESRSDRVVSLSKYKDGVLRDLRWLFNSSAHIEGDPIHDDPEAKTSVVNFGVRDLSGLVTDSIDLEGYRRHIIEAILAFEPRLNKRKLTVDFIDYKNAENSYKARATLRFEINGELYAKPMPERFFARTEVDLETGECHLV